MPSASGVAPSGCGPPRRTVKRRAGAGVATSVMPGRTAAIGGSSSTRFSFAFFVSSATIARPLRVSARPSGLPSSSGQLPDLVGARHRIADDELADPGDRLGLVAQQVEVAVRADLQVAEVLADGRQLDRRVPDRERHEHVIALVGRPPGAALERGRRPEPGRLVARRPELDERRRVLLLGDQQMAVLHERRALTLRALGVDPRVVERMPLGDLEGDPGGHACARPSRAARPAAATPGG